PKAGRPGVLRNRGRDGRFVGGQRHARGVKAASRIRAHPGLYIAASTSVLCFATYPFILLNDEKECIDSRSRTANRRLQPAAGDRRHGGHEYRISMRAVVRWREPRELARISERQHPGEMGDRS